MREQPFIGKSLVLMGGFLVWAFHLGSIYAFTSVACTQGTAERFGQTAEFFAILAVTLLSLLADAGLILLAAIGVGPGLAEKDGRSRSFWRLVTGFSGGISAVAVIWQALPAVLLVSCR